MKNKYALPRPAAAAAFAAREAQKADYTRKLEETVKAQQAQIRSLRGQLAQSFAGRRKLEAREAAE